MDQENSTEFHKKRTRAKKDTVFLCSSCGDTKAENFYTYLPSRCIKCKRKYSKERRTDISSEKKLKEVENKDYDGRIRDVLETLLAYDKILYGDSVLDFIKESEARISSLELEVDNRFERASSFLNINTSKNELLSVQINEILSIIELQNQKISNLQNILLQRT